MERIGLALMIVLGLALAPAARAGTIPDGTYTGSGPGRSDATASTLTLIPNNYDTPDAGPNILALVSTITGATPSAVDIVFPTLDSNGTTEYFVTAVVTNSSQSAWTFFEFLLGSGTGNVFVKGDTRVNFDTQDKLPYPSSLDFGLVRLFQSQDLVWTDGTVLPGQTAQFSFSIDVPDQSAHSFTLRQSVVPEPSSLVLSLFGALAIVGLVWRRCRVTA